MTRLFYLRAAKVIMVFVAMSVAASVTMTQAAPLPEGAAASGGVAQSGNCSGGPQQDEHCLPGGPGSPAGSNSTPTPPVTPPVPPPTMPPVIPPARPSVTFPIVPPPGIPPEELPTFIWGRANATLHIHDENQDVTYR